MEIEGKIIVVLPEQSGVSARTGSAWKSQEFVIETHEQYPRKCCFRVFGADRLATMNIQSGEEYNGRWFNNISAWKVERIDPMAAQAAAQAPQPSATDAFPPAPSAAAASVAPASEENSADDLPF